MLPGWIAAGWTAAALSILSGCAGPSKKGGAPEGGVALPQELSKELPKEVAEKFEVRDVAASQADSPAGSSLASPSPDPSSQPAGPSGKKKKRKGKAEPSPRPSVAPVGTAPARAIPNRRPKAEPIWQGERLVFEVTYFGMSAGDFTLDVLPYKTIAGRKAYHVKGVAVSSKVFSLFYRLNDTVETFFDYEGLFSHRFQLKLDESKQSRDSLELNDSDAGRTFFWNRHDHFEKGYNEKKEWADMTPFSQDSLSALYFLRTVPLPPGGELSIPIVSEGKNWEAVVSVVRRETVRSPLGRVRAVVVKPETKYQGVLQKRGDSFLWLTDDERRFPLRLEAKVKIGTVVAVLKSVAAGTPPQNLGAPRGSPGQ